MINRNVSQVRKTLPSLIDDVCSKKEKVIINRRGKPVAQLVPCDIDTEKANSYPLRTVPIAIAEEFDEPMPDLWEALN